MIIDHKEQKAITASLSALKAENVFIYPTDTLYGFGGDARSEHVLNKLYELKARPEHMPVSMLVRDINMLSDYAYISPSARKLIEEYLPGALTLVLPAKDVKLPSKLFSMDGYLGFRIPDHDFCQKITEEFNAPIITSSVNKSGCPALNDIKSIDEQFGDEVELMISDKTLDKTQNAPGSSVVMIQKDDRFKILREGKISRSLITGILQ